MKRIRVLTKALTTTRLAHSMTGDSGRRALILYTVNRYFADVDRLEISFVPFVGEESRAWQLQKGVVKFRGTWYYDTDD